MYVGDVHVHCGRTILYLADVQFLRFIGPTCTLATYMYIADVQYCTWPMYSFYDS